MSDPDCNDIMMSDSRNILQLKYQEKMDKDVSEIVKMFDKNQSQPCLDKLCRMEESSKECLLLIYRLSRFVRHVNPHIIEFDSMPSYQQNKTPPHSEYMIFIRSAELCFMFEERMKSFGWQVRDSYPMERDICSVVVKTDG